MLTGVVTVVVLTTTLEWSTPHSRGTARQGGRYGNAHRGGQSRGAAYHTGQIPLTLLTGTGWLSPTTVYPIKIHPPLN